MGKKQVIQMLVELLTVALGGYSKVEQKYGVDALREQVELAYYTLDTLGVSKERIVTSLACDIMSLASGQRGTGVSDVGMAGFSRFFVTWKEM